EQVSPALRRALVSDAVRVLLQLAWPFTWPARWYWSHSEHQVGKKLLVDRLLKQLLPSAPAEFEAELTGGGRVFLQHRDDLGTVDVHAVALAEKSGEVLLRLGADPAFHSTTTVIRARETCDCAVVEAQTLDSVWQAAGSPEVSFLKIDTEGGELEILGGGRG